MVIQSHAFIMSLPLHKNIATKIMLLIAAIGEKSKYDRSTKSKLQTLTKSFVEKRSYAQDNWKTGYDGDMRISTNHLLFMGSVTPQEHL